MQWCRNNKTIPSNYFPLFYLDKGLLHFSLFPGEKIALMSIKYILAMDLREFKLELSPKTKYPIQPINNPILFTFKDVRVHFVTL